MAPRLVFVFNDGHLPRKVPIIMGLEVCPACRPGLMQRPSVRQAAQDVLESLMPTRPFREGRQDVEMELEWVPVDSPEYKGHKGQTPS